MTTPATTPADGELLQRIAENDPSWVLKYLEQNTRFDVPRIRELFEFAKARAVAALATPSPGKADAEDAARYRQAIALEDNAETLYAAVLNHGGGNVSAINAEFDATMRASIQQERDK